MSPQPPLSDQIENAYSRIGVTGSHRFVMVMILLGVFFDALEQNAVGLTGPVLKEVWGLSTGDIGLLNTMTFTATALGRIVTGLVADKFGRRTLLIVNLVIFAAGSLACALAPNYAFLAAARFIVGFGLGGEIAVAVVMTAEYFAARQRGTAVALINVTAAGFGNMLAPAFGIAVYAIFTGPDRWRWLFGLLFLPAILVLYFRRYVPETPRYLAMQGKVHEANIVLTKFANADLRHEVTAVTEYIVAGESDVIGSRSSGSSNEYGERNVTGAATVVAGQSECDGASGGQDRTIHEASWLDVLRGKYLSRTLLLAVAVACSYAAQISMLTLMPTILVNSGYQVSTSLWFTLVMQSGSLVGACVAAFMASRWPRKRTLTIAAIVGCLAGVSLAVIGSAIALIILFGWFFNFAVIIQNTTIWLFAPEHYPTRIRGFGTSIILAIGSVSGGIFPLLAGRIFDASGLGGMFATLAVLFVIIAIVVQFPPETFGKPLEEEDSVTGGHLD